jgi:hypothetical protein
VLYRLLTVLQVLSVYSRSRYCLCCLSTCSHTVTDLILLQFEYMLANIIHLPPSYFVSVPAVVFCKALTRVHSSRARFCFHKIVCVKLKDRKRSLSGKNDHNASWHYRNSHNAKFCVVEVTEKTVRVSD